MFVDRTLVKLCGLEQKLFRKARAWFYDWITQCEITRCFAGLILTEIVAEIPEKTKSRIFCSKIGQNSLVFQQLLICFFLNETNPRAILCCYL